jgi:ATP-dependent RNA helicase DeaD
VPDVATVIHTSPPIDSQVYTHRSGRTGRAGKRGRSVLLAPPNKRRKVGWLLADAGVTLKWLPVPSAAQVRAQLAARTRATLEAELDATLAEGPPPAHLAHAVELLSSREAAPVVAALLARLEPKRSAQPRDVQQTRAHEEERRPQWNSPRKDGYQRDSYKNDGPRKFAPRPGSAQRMGRFERGGGVRFFINWGVNQGANPSRLLAAICRRGEVKGSDIGSIAVHPNASTFDVNIGVAERFERLAGRRDPRDPQIRIRRDRGPQAGSKSGPPRPRR